MTIPILTTKLYVPSPRPDLVLRPRLIEHLNIASSKKVTLITAPAGFGKSTLVSAWAHEARSQLHIAWLALDEDDNDLTRFLVYIIAALRTLENNLGESALVALQSPGTVNIEVVLISLLNELAEFSDDVVLVIDDYHVIELKPIDQVVTFLLDHLPPQVHLVISSRIDPSLPLSRLRASGQMVEIRANDLRFMMDEAAAFLSKELGFDLSDAYVASLQKRTEGWITGLKLAALSMQSSDDVEKFVHAFSGSDRYILDYLGEEVLAHQPQDVQMFLLQTSILSRLTGSLCQAVTNETHGDAMIAFLERRNMFIFPMDNERRWYRYHHLFRDLLYRHLNQVFPEQINELHQRASIWYQKSGDIDQAIYHSLAAGNIRQAADILEDHWQVFFVRGELTKLNRMLDSLGSEITGNSVILRMAYCMIYSQTGAIELIPSHTAFIRNRIKAIVESDVKLSSNLAAIPSLFETMEAIVALDNAQASKAKEHAKKAISLIPVDSSPVDRRRLILAANFRLGQAHRELGENDQACAILLEVLEMLKATESFYAVSTVIQLVSLYQESGKKQEALTLCEETLHFVAEKHWDELPPVGQIHVALAGLQADAGNIVAAQDNLDAGRELLKQQTTPEIISMIQLVEEKLCNISQHQQSLVEPLSPREKEVLQLIALGLSNREISEQLFVSLDTIKGHNHRIFGKLGVRRRTEAVARARDLDLL